MKRIIFLMTFLFYLPILASGYGYFNTDELNNSQTEYNLTLDSSPFSEMVWITIPRKANITSAEWILTGYDPKIEDDTEDEARYIGWLNDGVNDTYRNPLFAYDENYSTHACTGFTTTASWSYTFENYTYRNISSWVIWNGFFYRTYNQIFINVSFWNYTASDWAVLVQMSGGGESFHRPVIDFSGSNLTDILTEGYPIRQRVSCFDNQANGYCRYYEGNLTWYPGEFDPSEDTPDNITIDTGNDNSNDYTNTTEFNTNETIDLNITAINYYLHEVCSADWDSGNCYVPFNVSSVTSGIVEISGINISGDYNPSNLSVDAFNEETMGAIIFNITLTNGTQTFNATNCSNTWVELIENLPTGYVTVYISSSGFVQRTYILSLSHVATTNLEAYLLLSGTGIYHSTFVIASNNNIPIEDALVTVQMDAGGYYRTVEQHYTDTTGLVLNFLNPITQYHFIVSADDYVSETYEIYPNPVSPIVYVRLAYTGIAGADFVNYSVLWDSISYQFLPDTFYFNDSFNVTFELSSSDNDIEYIGLNATYQNTTLVCNELVDDQPAGTMLTCTIPYVVGQYEIQGYFKRINYTEHPFNIFHYWVFNSTSGGLPDIDFSGTVSDLGYWIACIILTMIVCGLASRFIGFGAGYLAVGMMAMAVALNPTIVIAGTMGWMIIALMVLALISLTVIRAYI